MTGRPKIRLVLADVDGTLVTQEKILTDRAVAAVPGEQHVVRGNADAADLECALW